MSTIYALSTVFGKSGVAVFRVSGPDALKVLDVFGIRIERVRARFAYFAKLCDADRILDEVIVIYFASPASFTGEDVVELHSHGSIAVLNYISAKLSVFFRPAEPGEFTRRAVLNNKMDLTKAEGIMDLIDAETKIQLKQASRHLSGDLRKEYQDLRDQVVKILSNLEAYIDFPDEDIPETLVSEMQQSVVALKEKISSYLKDGKIGEKIREGFTVVIVGKPNAGKSTLFNYLAKRDLAIVTNIPGTTRDTLEVRLDCYGYPVILVDTAGIQNTDDIIEKQGIDRAIKNASEADIIVFLRDIAELYEPTHHVFDEKSTATDVQLSVNHLETHNKASIFPSKNKMNNDDNVNNSILAGELERVGNSSLVGKNSAPNSDPEEGDRKQHSSVLDKNKMQDVKLGHVECDVSKKLTELLAVAKRGEIPVIKIATKADFSSESVFLYRGHEYISVSVHKERGINKLLEEIFSIISSIHTEAHIITRQRHRIALENALTHLQHFSMSLPIELAAEEIRFAANEIGSITGEIPLDEILDEIFSTFCIGK